VDSRGELEEGVRVYDCTWTFWSCIVDSVIHTVQDEEQKQCTEGIVYRYERWRMESEEKKDGEVIKMQGRYILPNSHLPSLRTHHLKACQSTLQPHTLIIPYTLCLWLRLAFYINAHQRHHEPARRRYAASRRKLWCLSRLELTNHRHLNI
jgi:hypothetical protein